MSILQTYLFDNDANYTKSNTVVEGGIAKLSLIPNTGQLFSNTFDNDTGFTYDNSKSEFIAGVLRQKDRTPANSVLYGNLQAKDLNWRKDSGSLTGTLYGSPSFSGSGIACTGAQGVYWSGTSLAQETLVVKYTPNYTGAPPANINIIGTSGASSPNNDRFHLTHSPSGDTFRITVRDSTGNLLVNAGTIGGSSINLQTGTTYHLAVVLDTVAKKVHLYIKTGAGAWALHGTYSSALGSWTRGGVNLNYRVGADQVVYDRAEATFSEFSHYNAVLDPTITPITDPIPNFIYGETKIDGPTFSYTGVGSVVSIDDATFITTGTPRYIVGLQYWNGSEWTLSDGTYSQANDEATLLSNLNEFNTGGGGSLPWSVVFPTSNDQSTIDSFEVEVTGEKYSSEGYLEPITSISVSELLSYEHDVTNTANTDMKIILKIDGQLTYWNGSNWVDSDGTIGQSNTESEIADNLGSLTFGVNSFVIIRWLMTTTENTETPELESVSISYDFGGVAPALTTCLVYGYVKDIGNQPIEGVTLRFSLVKDIGEYREATNTIIESAVEVLTDVNGYFEQELIKTSQYSVGGKYKVTITKDQTINTKTNDDSSDLTFDVPDDNQKDLTELLPSV